MDAQAPCLHVSNAQREGITYAFIPFPTAGIAASPNSVSIYAFQWPGLQLQHTAVITSSDPVPYHTGTDTSTSSHPIVQIDTVRSSLNSFVDNTNARNSTGLPLSPSIDIVMDTSPSPIDENMQSDLSTTTLPAPNLNLLTIPAEIRTNLYRHLFHNSLLDINKRDMTLINPNDEFSVYGLLQNVDLTILNTCSFVRNEAIASLNAFTNLNIFNHFGQTDPLAILPDNFLKDIRTIQVEVDAFIHINRARLPALKQVNLIHEVDGVESFVNMVDAMVNSNNVVGESMGDVVDWKWKLNQFTLVAEEEGFAVKMTAMWDCYSEGAEARVDVVVDLVSGVLVGLKGFIGSQEVAVVDKRQAELDWVSYGEE